MMDQYEEQLEKMRQALSKAWDLGYVQGWLDRPEFRTTLNPYTKEN